MEKMGIHFLLVGLLCLCGLSLSHECRRELLVNVDFPGTDITRLRSPDAEHCQLLCTQHHACLFFSFIRSDWIGDTKRKFSCYLKSTPSGQPNVQKPLQGLTSGFSLKPCHPDPQPCLSQVYHHVDFPGADYRALFTPDYEECQRVCTHDPGCQFFTFLKRDFADGNYRNKCHLKFSWTVPKIPEIVRLSTIISGFSQRMQLTPNFGPACKGGLFPNTNIPGHDIEVLPAVSPEHCQALCSAHPRCTHFSYVSDPFKCYLKDNPQALVSKSEAGVTSGLPARFCQLDNNWIKKTYVGIDFSHSDIRNFQASGVEACQRACTEDPSCQYYSYITAEISHAASRRRCFLKRVITMPAPPGVGPLAHAVSGFSLRNCYHNGIV